jgi:hypothetical protein
MMERECVCKAIKRGGGHGKIRVERDVYFLLYFCKTGG